MLLTACVRACVQSCTRRRTRTCVTLARRADMHVAHGVRACVCSVMHQKTHSNVRDCLCKHCDYSAKQRIDVVRHQLRHHSSEKPFLCEVCGKGFVEVWSLQLHSTSEYNYTSHGLRELPGVHEMAGENYNYKLKR